MRDDTTVSQETRDRPASKPVRSKLAGTAMFMLALLLICGDVWWIVYIFSNDALGEKPSRFMVFLFFVSVFTPLTLALWAWLTGRRMMMPAAEQVLAHDKRDPVIYLRPFAEDDRIVSSTPLGKRNGGEKIVSIKDRRASREREIKRALRKIGPVVAIGKPGDRLAPLGVARLYVADREWQDKVEALVRRAAAVVICPEATEGTSWELKEVARFVDPRRILMIVPNPRLRPLGYARIQALTARMWPVPLPADCQIVDAFMFDQTAQPRPIIFGRKLAPALGGFIDQIRQLSGSSGKPA